MIQSGGTWLGVLTLVAATTAVAADGAGTGGPKVPVALVWSPGGRVHVALRDARRLVEVDPRDWRVIAERPLPFRPCSMVLAEDGSTFLVGGMDGEMAAVDSRGCVLYSAAPGKGPTRVLALTAGRAAVASCWDASVRVVDWRGGRALAEHRLPFPAGAMVATPDGRVVVAHAFGGTIAHLKPGEAGTQRLLTFEGVNLQALAVSGDGKELLLAHMEQDDPAPVTEANIDRGIILSSRLSAVRLADLDAEPGPDEPLPRRQVTLDGPVHGAADPSAMAVSPDGNVVLIALAGAHQVLKNDRGLGSAGPDERGLLPLGHNQRLDVLEVGRGPVALAIDPSGRLAATADAMSDTMSVVRVDTLSRVATIALGPTPAERTPAQRGEALFLDGRRSHDRWMSCASCHNAGHTNGLNFDTRGDGGFGAPKNTPSLLGVAGTEPMAWNGMFPSIAGQVHQSLESSLRGPEPQPGAVDDLVAYLRTLPSPPPRRRHDDPAAVRGAEVFRARRCDSCHRPPSYTIAGLRDVGIDDGVGRNRRFNPPALRGVAWSAPYFHDGRAPTLEQVVDSHMPGQKTPPSRAERDDLVAFLESL